MSAGTTQRNGTSRTRKKMDWDKVRREKVAAKSTNMPPRTVDDGRTEVPRGRPPKFGEARKVRLSVRVVEFEATGPVSSMTDELVAAMNGDSDFATIVNDAKEKQ